MTVAGPHNPGMAVNRRDLIERIESLSDEEIERVGPYLEADLDALVDLDELRDEVARGRESARTEPLLSHEEVVSMVRERLAKRP
jgi:hypothetical protein